MSRLSCLVVVLLAVLCATATVARPTEDVISEVLAALDTSVDPCEDFYTFSCGGWMKVRHHEGERGRASVVPLVSSRILVD